MDVSCIFGTFPAELRNCQQHLRFLDHLLLAAVKQKMENGIC